MIIDVLLVYIVMFLFGVWVGKIIYEKNDRNK